MADPISFKKLKPLEHFKNLQPYPGEIPEPEKNEAFRNKYGDVTMKLDGNNTYHRLEVVKDWNEKNLEILKVPGDDFILIHNKNVNKGDEYEFVLSQVDLGPDNKPVYTFYKAEKEKLFEYDGAFIDEKPPSTDIIKIIDAQNTEETQESESKKVPVLEKSYFDEIGEKIYGSTSIPKITDNKLQYEKDNIGQVRMMIDDTMVPIDEQDKWAERGIKILGPAGQNALVLEENIELTKSKGRWGNKNINRKLIARIEKGPGFSKRTPNLHYKYEKYDEKKVQKEFPEGSVVDNSGGTSLLAFKGNSAKQKTATQPITNTDGQLETPPGDSGVSKTPEKGANNSFIIEVAGKKGKFMYLPITDEQVEKLKQNRPDDWEVLFATAEDGKKYCMATIPDAYLEKNGAKITKDYDGYIEVTDKNGNKKVYKLELTNKAIEEGSTLASAATVDKV
ncbi:MAG: hypothetical protein GX568_07450, partial [Candidatus Gastranaerophilales bacterium]|nr:hypothetical protein [Candidatus Gastranaerophilales bacterium]